MNEELTRIIAKIAAGTALTGEEKNYLCQKAPQEWAELTRRNQELTGKLNDVENRALPETEQLKRRFESEVAELREKLVQSETARSAAAQEAAALHYRRRTDRLAESCGFSDPDYFEFLCRQESFDPAQEEECASFINRLKEGHPRFFKLDLHPGPAEETAVPAAGSMHFTIEEMLTDAPSISE